LNVDEPYDPWEFRRRFDKAVERRIVSDVPVGTCLSGGLDSSSIVGSMARLLIDEAPDINSLGEKLKTFSAVFEGDPIDEQEYIDAVLQKVPADPVFVRPESGTWWTELCRWVWYMEEPTITTAPYAMWSVMKKATESVTVLLDGQAGDELLGGYVPYHYVYLRQLFNERKLAPLLREAWLAKDILVPLVSQRIFGRSKRVDIHQLLDNKYASKMNRPKDLRVNDDLKKRLSQDLTTYSLPSLLRYEDRNSMAHSLESRLPFLDQELVDYVFRLPAEAIIHNGWSRRVLREGLEDVLPAKVRLRRKKIGFTTPEFRWFRRQRSNIQSILQSPSFYSRPYWDAPEIWKAFRQACAGSKDESMFFWRAINVEIWLREYIDSPGWQPDIQDESEFIAIGDRSVQDANPAAVSEEFVHACNPNAGKHLFTTDESGGIYVRAPLKTSMTIGSHDDIGAVLEETIDMNKELAPIDGDMYFISEKVVAITQGRSLPIDEIEPSPIANWLSRFVRRVPFGIGLGHPATMQLAIEEVGVMRILLAALCGALTRPLGIKGVFYRVAGARVGAIDGPTANTLPPYNTHASKAPSDPESVADHLSKRLSQRYGVGIDVVIVDANDIGVNVLGSSKKVPGSELATLFLDNPLGQSSERTPFALVRRIGKASRK
ncbi:MAG TPA: asparagine synthase-related protein, partial [Acidimicrobiales bacterium]|nr:asparagine synthase-related protein [Acidimicrobiales bacterium]